MKKAEADHTALLFSSCKANTNTPEEALSHFEAINDMLEMQKSQSLINGLARKKGRRSFQHKGFLQCLDNRISQLIIETNA